MINQIARTTSTVCDSICVVSAVYAVCENAKFLNVALRQKETHLNNLINALWSAHCENLN